MEKSSNQVAYIDGCSWEKSSKRNGLEMMGNNGKYLQMMLNGGFVRWERYRLHHGKI